MRIHRCTQHRADHLVQRVMPADILAHQLQATIAPTPSRRMHRAGRGVHRLRVTQRCQRHRQYAIVDDHAGAQRGRLLNHVFQGATAAYAAPAASGQFAFGECPRTGRATDVQHDALEHFIHVHAIDVRGPVDQAFARGEAPGEIDKVVRGQHHHGKGRAIDAHLHRHFLGQPLVGGGLHATFDARYIAPHVLGKRHRIRPHARLHRRRPERDRHGFVSRGSRSGIVVFKRHQQVALREIHRHRTLRDVEGHGHEAGSSRGGPPAWRPPLMSTGHRARGPLGQILPVQEITSRRPLTPR